MSRPHGVRGRRAIPGGAVALAVLCVVVAALVVLRPAGYRADDGMAFTALAVPAAAEDRVFRYGTDQVADGTATGCHAGGGTLLVAAEVDRDALEATGHLVVTVSEGTEAVTLFVAAAEGDALRWFVVESADPVNLSAPAGGALVVGLESVPTGQGASFTVRCGAVVVTETVASHATVDDLYEAIATALQQSSVDATAIPSGVRITSPAAFAGGGDQDGTAGRIRVRSQW